MHKNGLKKWYLYYWDLQFARLSMKTDLPCFVPSGGSVVHSVESFHSKKSPPREGGGEKGRLSSKMNSHTGETKQRIRAGAFTHDARRSEFVGSGKTAKLIISHHQAEAAQEVGIVTAILRCPTGFGQRPCAGEGHIEDAFGGEAYIRSTACR